MLNIIVRILSGPLIYFRSRRGRAVALVTMVLVLTALTQVGGAVLWVALPFLEFLYRRTRRFGVWTAKGVVFAGYIAAYAVTILMVVPPLAARFGRQPLPCFATADRPLAAASAVFCAANRNYAKPHIRRLLARVSRRLAAHYPGAIMTYLDAGFPFFDGFPLLPHLSHRNGTTVDLAFFYLDTATGRPLRRAGAWPLGYWNFAQPRTGEPQLCRRDASGPTLRWDMSWLQPLFSDVRLDETRTQSLIKRLIREARSGAVDRMFLEPYLRARWGLPRDVVRFQGCRAARHDDHVHIQFK